jgi:membrane protein YdbS with pleckstrin-like domain
METIELKPLDRKLLRLMQVRGAIAGLLVLAAAGAGEGFADRLAPLPFGFLIGPAFLVFLYVALVAPPRRYRAWACGMDREELQVRRGVLTRVHTVVPLDHVQHIDVSQGPLERAFGICSLILHTAGTLNSQIVLPGLDRDSAERMRDEIRGRIDEAPE